MRQWPASGQRLWLITRDRGSAQGRRLSAETIARLTPLAAKVEVFSFMPYPPLDRKVRELFLRRPVSDAYLKVYLFTPPQPSGGRTPQRPGRPAGQR